MVWVLCQWPSLSLLRSLTEPRPGDCDHLRRASILSVCVACSTLLTDPERQPLVLQLLDDLVHRGVTSAHSVGFLTTAVDDLWPLTSDCGHPPRGFGGRYVRRQPLHGGRLDPGGFSLLWAEACGPESGHHLSPAESWWDQSPESRSGRSSPRGARLPVKTGCGHTSFKKVSQYRVRLNMRSWPTWDQREHCRLNTASLLFLFLFF